MRCIMKQEKPRTTSTLGALLLAASTALPTPAHAQDAPECTAGVQTTTHSILVGANMPFSDGIVQENVGYAGCNTTTLAAWYNHHQGAGWIDKGISLEQGVRRFSLGADLMSFDGIGTIGQLRAQTMLREYDVGVQQLIGFGNGRRAWIGRHVTKAAAENITFSAGAELGFNYRYAQDHTGLDAHITGSATYNAGFTTITMDPQLSLAPDGKVFPAASIGLKLTR